MQFMCPVCMKDVLRLGEDSKMHCPSCEHSLQVTITTGPTQAMWRDWDGTEHWECSKENQ
jgi:hypothetical protein